MRDNPTRRHIGVGFSLGKTFGFVFKLVEDVGVRLGHALR